MGPFALLRKEFNFNIVTSDTVDESILDLVDFVFMQRPSTDGHAKVAEMCKINGTPLWIDYDDFLFEVPQDNPAYDAYMKREVHNNIVKIIRMADVVTVSTEQLKRCLQPKGHVLNERVYVVHNALHDKYLRLKQPFKFKPHINWRGSRTHMRDIMEYAPEVAEFANKHQESTFTFIGDNPWYLTQNMPRKQAIVVPPMGINDYFQFITKTNPSIQIVPLHDSMFNRCKSNIAWIEASLAGAICIAPRWQEWEDKPGCLTYSTPEEFRDCLEYAIANPDEMAQQHALGFEYIQKNLLLSNINVFRNVLMQCLYALVRGAEVTFPRDGEALEEEAVMELE